MSAVLNSHWPLVPLRQILRLQRRWLKLDPLESYGEIGIRCFGKGVFHKAPVMGSSLGNKRVLQIHPGDLVFNNVFAWEGAVAVAGPAEVGKIGSHRFVTYTPDAERCSVEYLKYFFASKAGLVVLGKASPGSAGRNRTLNLDRFIVQCVPLPPLAEQLRLVALIDVVAAKVEEAKQLRIAASNRAQALVSGLHLHLSIGRKLRMDQILVLDEDRVDVQVGQQYPQIGIKGFGEGLFARGSLDSTQTTYKAFNRLYAGAVVLSQVKGWEGAIAVCGTDLVGRYASPEYRTFRCLPDAALPQYLAALFATPWFWTQLKHLTRGVGARRERIRPELFLQMEISMPTLEDQRAALLILNRSNELQRLQGTTAAQFDAIVPSLLDRVFKGEL